MNNQPRKKKKKERKKKKKKNSQPRKKKKKKQRTANPGKRKKKVKSCGWYCLRVPHVCLITKMPLSYFHNSKLKNQIIEWWKQSYRLPNNLFAMGPTIFELWVMETENWVIKKSNPNGPLVFTYPFGKTFIVKLFKFCKNTCGWKCVEICVMIFK